MAIIHEGRVLLNLCLVVLLSLPAFAAEGDEPTGLKLTTKKQTVYCIPAPDDRGELDSLDAPGRERFFKNRAALLRLAANTVERFAKPERVQSILQGLDKVLWDKAALFSKVNEIGASLEGGLDAGAKVGKHGLYGITGVGLITAYDREKRALVFELYQDFDVAKMAIPFYGGVGIFGSLLLSATHHNPEDPLRIEKGEGFCTLGISGCMTSRNLRLGVTGGLALGFPSTSLVTSEVHRVPYLRISLSPKFPFVGVKVLGTEPLKQIGRKISDGPIRLVKAIGSGCRRLFGYVGGGES